jgi:hypothetical protein
VHGSLHVVFGITVSKVWGMLIQLILYSPVPALRGKDYGKTRMNYPDYVQSQSGLQYKVCGQLFQKHSLLAKMKSFNKKAPHCFLNHMDFFVINIPLASEL